MNEALALQAMEVDVATGFGGGDDDPQTVMTTFTVIIPPR